MPVLRFFPLSLGPFPLASIALSRLSLLSDIDIRERWQEHWLTGVFPLSLGPGLYCPLSSISLV